MDMNDQEDHITEDEEYDEQYIKIELMDYIDSKFLEKCMKSS